MLGQRTLGSLNTSPLWVTGVIMVLFSVVVSVLIFFNAIPSSCTFLTGIELLIVGALLIAGLFIGTLGVFRWRKKKGTSSPGFGGGTPA